MRYHETGITVRFNEIDAYRVAWHGHYVAWICASLLFALALQVEGPGASNAPGPMVYSATGWAGLVCVVIAGWTTARSN